MVRRDDCAAGGGFASLGKRADTPDGSLRGDVRVKLVTARERLTDKKETLTALAAGAAVVGALASVADILGGDGGN